MNKITVIGIDLAKSSFQLHGVNSLGQVVLQKKISRAKLADFIVKMPPCLIGMEACSGASFWARKFQKFGHTVKLISPQFVKPYVKSNKNDANDAEAICEAVTRPSMRFVCIKSVEQQDIQSIHRIRSRLVKEKTALMNSIRGLLHEYGYCAPQGVSALKKMLVNLIDEEPTEICRFFCADLYAELLEKEDKISKYDKKISAIYNSNEVCKKIGSVPGVGKQTATIIYTMIGDGSGFKNGREFSAYLGLVPRQNSTGGKSKLLGISKRGDKYTRSLLVHGARSVIYHAGAKIDKRSQWINKLKVTKGANKTAVAVANRNARIIWSIVKNDTVYKSMEELKRV